jgi:UDP-N-acetylglucosamine 4,6-dehydratase
MDDVQPVVQILAEGPALDLRLPEAVETALDAAVLGEHGELWVKKMPSTTVGNLIEAIAPPGYPTIDIGIRPGEKMHEVLVNEDEMRRAEDRKHCYVIDRNQTQLTGEYTSANAEQISVENLRELLQKCEVLPS